MTQVETRNAVNSIKLKLIQLIYDVDAEHEHAVQAIIDDVLTLERSLSIRHFIHAPNCRPATKEELAALGASSNVVAFRPAA